MTTNHGKPPHILTPEEIAANQEAARRPALELTLFDNEERNLFKARGMLSSATVAVCKGLPPKFNAQNEPFIVVDWYSHGELVEKDKYERLKDLERAPKSTPYPKSYIPF
jgi:hypothetical protein